MAYNKNKNENKEKRHLKMTIGFDNEFNIEPNLKNKDGVSSAEMADFLAANEKIFDLISVPITCSRADIENDDSLTGDVTVGWVAGYDHTSQLFDIIIFQKYTRMTNWTYPLVRIKPLARDGRVEKILKIYIVK